MDHTQTDVLLEKAWAKLVAGEGFIIRKQLEARKDRVFAIVRQTLDEEGLYLAYKFPTN